MEHITLGYAHVHSRGMMSSIRRIIAQFLIDIAIKVDDELVLDVACDIAMDNEFGYCPDCTPERNEGWE